MAAPILLVHDDIAVIATVRRLLGREGYEVVLATSAADAVIAFGHYLPGLIVLAPSVEGGRGHVVLEELAQHPDGKLVRVLLLGETIPGFAAAVVPLPLEGATFLERVQEIFRAGSDAQNWQVSDSRHQTEEVPALVPPAPEDWRAAAPPEVSGTSALEHTLFDDVSGLQEENWALAAMTPEQRAEQAEAAAQAAFEQAHQEVEAEAIASIESSLGLEGKTEEMELPAEAAPAKAEDDLDALEAEVRAEAAERRRLREAREAAAEAARREAESAAKWSARAREDAEEQLTDLQTRPPQVAIPEPDHSWMDAAQEPAPDTAQPEQLEAELAQAGVPESEVEANPVEAPPEEPALAEAEPEPEPVEPVDAAAADATADPEPEPGFAEAELAEPAEPEPTPEAAAAPAAEPEPDPEAERKAREAEEAKWELEELERQLAADAERKANEAKEAARAEAERKAKEEAEAAAQREIEALEREAKEAARAEAEQKARAEIERLEREREAAAEEAARLAEAAAEQEAASRLAKERAEALASRERLALAAASKAQQVAVSARREADAAAEKLRAQAEAEQEAARRDAERAEAEIRRERETREALAQQLADLQRAADQAREEAEKARRAAEEEREAREAAEVAAAKAREEAEARAKTAVLPVRQGSRTTQVPAAGTVDLPGLTRLVALLCRAEGDFRLELRAGSAHRALWIRRGALVGASSSLASESLLDRARRDGLLDAAQEAELRFMRGGPAPQLLEALKARGYLREVEAVPLAQRYVEQIALEAFSEPDSDFRVVEGELPPDVVAATAPRPALHGLIEGLRRAIDVEELLQAWGGLRAQPAPIAAGSDWRALGFSDRERRLLDAVDGEATLESLLLSAGLKVEAGLRAIAAAAWLGELEVKAADPEPARAPDLDLRRLDSKFEQVQEADYFTILGLPRSAGADEVVRAFRHLSEEFHPLKFAALPDLSLQQRAQQIHEALSEAAHVLQDDRLRAEYARHLID